MHGDNTAAHAARIRTQGHANLDLAGLLLDQVAPNRTA